MHTASEEKLEVEEFSKRTHTYGSQTPVVLLSFASGQ